jgi:uncharacterized protein DUF2845
MKLIIVATLLAFPMIASADSMRCGQWVVNEETTPSELLQKCGEPQQKEVSTEDVMTRNPAGYTRKTGVQVIEKWHYQRSSAALPMLVVVVDGKIKSIERSE